MPERAVFQGLHRSNPQSGDQAWWWLRVSAWMPTEAAEQLAREMTTRHLGARYRVLSQAEASAEGVMI